MIGWYPGHMVKAQRLIKEKLSLVDMVLELLDSRIPYSSKNPIFDSLLSSKKRILVLTKKDLADDPITDSYLNYYKNQSYTTFTCNLKEPRNFKSLLSFILSQNPHKNKPFRLLVVGIPNVGKSTLINQFIQKKKAKVENRVGVTKSLQWYKHPKLPLELLDTPGISMPHFDPKEKAIHMAIAHSLRLEVIPLDIIVEYLISFMIRYYKKDFYQYYKIDNSQIDYSSILIHISKKMRKQKGGKLDYDLLYEKILLDFQKTKVAKITLDQWDIFSKEKK